MHVIKSRPFAHTHLLPHVGFLECDDLVFTVISLYSTQHTHNLFVLFAVQWSLLSMFLTSQSFYCHCVSLSWFTPTLLLNLPLHPFSSTPSGFGLFQSVCVCLWLSVDVGVGIRSRFWRVVGLKRMSGAAWVFLSMDHAKGKATNNTHLYSRLRFFWFTCIACAVHLGQVVIIIAPIMLVHIGKWEKEGQHAGRTERECGPREA